MSIIRREPFRDLMSIREAMDRLFEENFVRTRIGAMVAPSMPIDMYETDDAIVVEAPISGARTEDIDVSILGNDLTIRAELKMERDIKEENLIVSERRYGSVSRTVSLPVSVDSDQAKASYENGVLRLTLPKAESAKAKQIKVQTT